MHPNLIEIPFIHFTIHSFGPMMMLGFLAGLLLIRRLSRRAGLAPTPSPRIPILSDREAAY